MLKRKEPFVYVLCILCLLSLISTVFADPEVCASLNFRADTTFFSQNFNSFWKTDSPPSGWSIFYTAPLGTEDWHRDSAGVWSNNHSGYAKISYASKTFGEKNNFLLTEDSLISPIIDCNFYQNIVLRCSTSFRHRQNISYSAKIIGSIDGGLTYPYTIREYSGNYLFPQLETLRLNWTSEQANVRIAFVFSGNILGIEFWCLDNISLTGTHIFDTDAACMEIVSPLSVQTPGNYPVQVRIANLGKLDLYNFPVCCSIINTFGSPIYFDSIIIDTLHYRETLTATLPSQVTLSIPFIYHAKAWCADSGDENLGNDTINKNFAVGWTEYLSYCESNPAAGERFQVGEQGWGVKFKPSLYPALINKVRFYFSASKKTTTDYRYKIRIVDDDGIDSAPGTKLYETSIIYGIEGWNTTYLFSDSIFITSGAVYIFYIQVGDAPYAPLFYRDDAVNPIARYYQYVDSSYVRDYPSGDWLFYLVLEFTQPAQYNNDVRTVYIDHPANEFVRRPFNYQTPIIARIENIGLQNQTNFAVSCTVKSNLSGQVRQVFIESIPALDSGQGVSFDFYPPYPVRFNEPTKYIVCTHLLYDENTSNDLKSKVAMNTVGKFTGLESDTGYAWYDSDTTDGPVYNWIDTNNTYLLTDYADDTIIPVPPLPFLFNYYDTLVNRIYVSTNGFITFSNAQPSLQENSIIPSSNSPNFALYPFWDDLILPSNRSAKIYYKEIGTQPNRAFVIAWFNIARKYTDYTKRLNFQVLLYEDGKIIFQYKDVVCGDQSANYGKSATIGIENQDGSGGLQYLFGSETELINWPENKLSSGRAIKFYKQIRDIGPTLIISPPDTIVPGPIIPKAWIKNFGSTIEETFKVYFKVFPITSTTPIYDTFQYIVRINPGEQLLVEYPDWDAELGNYIVVCSTGFNYDENNSNDVVRKSVLVATWVLKAPVPDGPNLRKVKNGALVHTSVFNKIFALKGGNCNEFWSYDISANTWDSLPRLDPQSRKKPKAGCALAYDGASKIYAFKGGNTKSFFAYDILASTWQTLESLHTYKKIKDGAGLAYSDGLIYAIIGNNTNVLARYNPAGDTWQHENEVPEGLDRKKVKDGGSITAFNGILYIFKGNNSKELCRYDISQQQWLESCTIPGPNKIKSGGASTMQTSTGFIYLFSGGNKSKIWIYNTHHNSFDSTLTPIPLGPSRKKIKKGAAIVSTPIDLIYALKSGNTNEFWAYAFWGEPTLTKNEENRKDYHENTKARKSEKNPVNPARKDIITYNLDTKTKVDLKVYSITGKLITTLCGKEQDPGTYQISWNGTTLNSVQGNRKLKGVYFIKGTIGSRQISQKIIRF